MFDKLFGRSEPKKLEDPFGLRPYCLELGLSQYVISLQKSCRPSVAVALAEARQDLPHTASRLGGYPALPDRFEWPLNENDVPLKFLGQFTCGELSLAKLDGLPEEGLISIFLDCLDDEPNVAMVFHFSLKRDLLRRAPPRGPGPHPTTSPPSAYRPVFRTVPSLPYPGSKAFERLEIQDEDLDAYEELLLNVEHSLDPYQIRCGGHAPQEDMELDTPETEEAGSWEFFLALRDIEDLEILWPEAGCAVIWLPTGSARFVEGIAEITWQPFDDDWNEEAEEEEADEDEEDDSHEQGDD